MRTRSSPKPTWPAGSASPEPGFLSTSPPGIISGDALVGKGRNAGVRLEFAKRQIATRRDVAQALGNGASTRLTPTPARLPRDLECVQALTDPGHRTAVALGLILLREIGVSAAAMAVHAGAPMRAAYAVKAFVEVAFQERFEEALGRLGVPTSAITYRTDALSAANWASLAAFAGEEVDLPVWKAWQAERLAMMEALPEADAAPRH